MALLTQLTPGAPNYIGKVPTIRTGQPVNPTTATSPFKIPTDQFAWSGLPKQHRESLLTSLMPQVTGAAGALPETIKAGYGGAKDILSQLGQFYGEVPDRAKPEYGATKGVLDELSGFYRDMPETIMPYMARTMRGAKEATMEPFQGLLNQLSGRNMLSSQVTSDAMANLGKGLNKQMFGDMADYALQTQMASQAGQADVLGRRAGLEEKEAQTTLDILMKSLGGEADVMGQRADLEVGEAEAMAKEPGTLANLIGLGRATEQPFQPYQAFLNLMQSMM